MENLTNTCPTCGGDSFEVEVPVTYTYRFEEGKWVFLEEFGPEEPLREVNELYCTYCSTVIDRWASEVAEEVVKGGNYV